MDRRRFLVTSAAAVAAVRSIGCRAGQAPAAATDEALLRLNSNENPLGLAPSARQALIDGLGEANRYPFGLYERLKETLASKMGVEADNIVLANGSSELLAMMPAAFAPEGGTVLAVEPTFGVLPEQAGTRGVETRRFALTDGGAHPLEEMEEAALAEDGPVLVYICNPNNPTGTLTSCRAVQEWIERAPGRVWFFIDEAYFDYVRDEGYFTLAEAAAKRPRTLVARTFSKIYAMAGMRLGYGVAEPGTAEKLAAYAPGANVNHAAACAALGCFDDQDFLRRSFESNQQARGILTSALDGMGVEYFPSHTNFVFHRIKGDLKRYIEQMKEKGALVGRPFPPMLNWNRVSLGSPSEMEQFVRILRA